MGKVKVYRLWSSPYSMRVEIALKLKGVEYECVEEDIRNKSDQLLKLNPVHKKVPVLVHDGKIIAESLVIMEYIDETWKGNPILPSDPYERAHARFWARFIDDKLMPIVRSVLMSTRKESKITLEELDELFTILEKEIEGKKFFGGNKIGFLDIVASIVAYWISCLQDITNKEVLTREKYPCICRWGDQLLECDLMKQHLPNMDRLKAFYRTLIAEKKARISSKFISKI